ncbi:hypothetical protein QJS10_CPB21g01614 [Acorus calamus]|uniref:Cytochrome P450 n=1 Tax=Acorus calamus TaxID=4465 RepID=A0AAV9C696_ACOCL|nr:hypothetical protein QJS10_CPB21g01614 [Acorus calamus]
MDSAISSNNTQTAFLAVAIAVLFGWLYHKHKLSRPNLPPGSFGIGEVIGFARALKGGTAHKWIEERVARHGPIFMTSFMGNRIVVVTGSVGNKFVFTSGDDALKSHQPKPVFHITGEKSIFEVHGARHKLVKGAIAGFLRPESLQRFIPLMSSLTEGYLTEEVENKDSVYGVILLKKIAFKVSMAVLFSLTDDEETDKLFDEFLLVLKCGWILPIYLPFTPYYRVLAARRRIYGRFSAILDERRRKLEDGSVSPNDDIIATMLSMRDEEGRALPRREIIDNLITIVFASHDTGVSLTASFVRHLAMNEVTLQRVYEEHTKILNETKDETLTWSDIQKMKYTWSVAQELMRIDPPAFGNFRITARDIDFNGYTIPKGWNVHWVTYTHMDKTAFPEPEKFDPTRFEGVLKSFPPYTYVPFGGGQRVCPGSHFARVSLSLIIHHLVMNFRWSMLVPGEPVVRKPFAYPAKDLPIKVYKKEKEKKEKEEEAS